VEVRDSVDRRIAGANTAITLAIGANPGTATLRGTKTKNAINGTATFNDLQLATASVGYTLVAPRICGSDTSTGFDVLRRSCVDAVASGSRIPALSNAAWQRIAGATNTVGELATHHLRDHASRACPH